MPRNSGGSGPSIGPSSGSGSSAGGSNNAALMNKIDQLLTAIAPTLGGSQSSSVPSQFAPSGQASNSGATNISQDLRTAFTAAMIDAQRNGSNVSALSPALASSIYSQFVANQPPPPPTQPSGQPGGGASYADEIERNLAHALSHLALPVYSAGLSAVTGHHGGMGSLGGQALGAMARMAPEAAIPVGLLSAGMATMIEVNRVQASQNVREQQLTAGLSNGDVSSYATAHGVADDLRHAGQGFNYGPDVAQRVGAQMMAGGVARANDVIGGSSISMGLARLTGMDPTNTSGIISGRMSGGGEGWQAATLAIEDLQRAAAAAHVPLDKVTQSLDSLNTIAGKGAYSVTGMAAVQEMTGAGIDAGRLLSPSMGAQGSSALSQAGMLGMSASQFLAAQRDPAKMMAAIQNFAKRVGGGSGDLATRELTTESVLQSSGLLDTSGLSASQSAKLVNEMLTNTGADGKSFNVTQEAKRLQGAASAGRLDQGGTATQQASAYLSSIASNTAGLTPALDRLGIAVDNLFTDLATGGAPVTRTNQTAAHAHSAAQYGESVHAASNPMDQAEYNKLAQSQGWEWSTDPNHTYRKALPSGYHAQQILGADHAPRGWQVVPNDPRHLAANDPARLTGGGSSQPIMATDGVHGGTKAVPQRLMDYFAQASSQSGVPMSVLISQDMTESGLNPNAIQANGGGRGISQFDFSTSANAKNSANWLSQAEKLLGRGVGMDPKKAALDPQLEITAQSLYMQHLGATHGGNWQQALASYNGSGPAAQAYGQEVSGAAQHLDVALSGTLTVTDASGNQIGYATLNQSHHTVTPRRPVGHHPANTKR